MDTTTILILVVPVILALIVGGVIGIAFSSRQRTKRLQEKFGPEYEHALDDLGDKRKAERELQARLDHMQTLEIRPLSAEEIDDFIQEWLTIQTEFIDSPAGAVQTADRLISRVLKAKGYPAEDFEQGAADISVSYPDLVMDYRGLHSMALRSMNENLATEQMRQAMLHGRDLFETLIEGGETDDEISAELVEEEDEQEKVM